MSHRTEDVRMNKWWVQTLITIGVMIGGMSIAWGAYSSKVMELESRMKETKADHDLLISVNAKMDMMIVAINELRLDLKNKLDKSSVVLGK